MAGVTFSHAKVGTLNLRLPPTQVDWSYNVNTSVTNTYAGQVVQILSINFDRLTIQGRFGKEGARGARVTNNRLLPRPASQSRDYRSGGKYDIGLSQMTAYFQEYFTIASAGDNDRTTPYNQEPMTLRYEGRLGVNIDSGIPEEWKVYPVSFPSYKRSNDNFAPEWRVECEVFEESKVVREAEEQNIINRLSRVLDARTGVGYKPGNEFSDPAGRYLYKDGPVDEQKLQELIRAAQRRLREDINTTFTHYMDMLPALTPEDLDALLFGGGSMPIWLDFEVQNQNAGSGPGGRERNGGR